MKKFILITILSISTVFGYDLQIGDKIFWDGSGTTPTNDPAALIQMESTTQGFLPPRMNTTQRTALANVAGIIVYDTDLGSLQINSGASWSVVGASLLGDFQIVGNTLESVNTDQDINISPNGIGKVFIDTSLEVDNIEIDGQAITTTVSGNNLSISGLGLGSVIIEQLQIQDNDIFSTSGGIDLRPVAGNPVTAFDELRVSQNIFRVYAKSGEGAKVFLHDALTSNHSVSLQTPVDVTNNYVITFPADGPPAINQVLQSDAAGQLSWITTPVENLWSDAVNANIIPDTTDTYTLGNLTTIFNGLFVNDITISDPTAAGVALATMNAALGLFDISTSDGTDFRVITANSANNANVTGDIRFQTGDHTGTNNSGNVNIITGTAAANTSGDINLFTGVGNTSGDITLFTGLGLPTRGTIRLVNGSEGTAGHVWTSTGTGGEGSWVALPAGEIANRIEDTAATTFVNTELVAGEVHIGAVDGTVFKFTQGGLLDLTSNTGATPRSGIILRDGNVASSTQLIIRPNDVMNHDGSISFPANWTSTSGVTAGDVLTVQSTDTAGNVITEWATPAGGGGNLTISNGGAALTTAALSIDFGVPNVSGLLVTEPTTDNMKVEVNVNSLLTEAVPDGAADFLMMWDASASANKKVLINSLPFSGGDPTRIQDGSNNSYVDTDEVPGGVIINASNGIDSTDIVVGPTGSIVIKASPTPSTNRPEIRLTEAQVNGTNYVGLRPASSLASSFSLTLPTAQAGAANRRLVGDATGQLSFIAPDTVEPDITEANGWSAFTTAGSGEYRFAGDDTLSSKLVLYEANATGGTTGNSITLGLPLDVTADYSITLPAAAPALNQILQSDASGNLSWINTPAGGGGDSTRIEDAATTTFVDTDATTNNITFGALNAAGADATCRYAFNSAGNIDRNKFFFGNCNSHWFEMIGLDIADGTGHELPVLRIMQADTNLPNRLKSGVLQFYNFNSTAGQEGWNIKAPDSNVQADGFAMTLPADAPAVGEVLKISSVTAGTLTGFETEWDSIDLIEDADQDTFVKVEETADIDQVKLQAGGAATATLLANGQLALVGPPADALNRGKLELYEPTANGNNYVGIQGPLALTSDYTIELPGTNPFAGARLVVNSFSGGVASMAWDSYDLAYSCLLSYRTDDDVGGGPSTVSVASSFDKRRFTNAEGNCIYTGLSGTPVADATSIGDQYYTQFRLYGFQTTYFIHCSANTSPSSTGDILAIREPISGGVIYGKNANPGEPVTVSAIIVTPNPGQYYDYELVQYSASANADGHGAAATWVATTYEEHATCQIRVDNRF